MARNRSKNKRKKSSADSIAKTKKGQTIVGLTALTDAFIFGAASISKKDAIRSGRKLKGHQLVANARTLEADAEDTIEAGKEQAVENSRQGQQDASSLKARLASQGIQVDFGTGGQAVQDILDISGKDSSAIRMNAFRKAHNQKLRASEMKSQAIINRISSKKQERDTMLTGGLSALRAISGGIAAADGFSAFGGQDVSASNTSRSARDRVVT